jgi:hypothetical protein
MQTKQVLETIRRIQTKFSPIHEQIIKLQETIYTGAPDSPPRQATIGPLVIDVTYRFGNFIEEVLLDSDCVKVLEAFSLKELLLDKKFWFAVAGAISFPEQTTRERPLSQWSVMHRLLNQYDRMISCVQPFTILTIPPDLLSEPREDLLAINLSDRDHLDLKVLAKVVSEVEALYDSLNRVFGRTDATPLQVIKVESGSSLRIDLKGLADTIKELKNAVLEIWSKHRHKKADEIIDQHRVVSSGIEVLTEIDVRVKKKELTNEDGMRFRRAIVQSTLGLFKNGALIDEIPPTETVNNVKLLDGFAYRLLAAPQEDSETSIAASVDFGGPLLTAGSQGALPQPATPVRTKRTAQRRTLTKPATPKRKAT